MSQVKTAARNIKAACMRRVSVGGAHAPKHAKWFFSESKMCFDRISRQERGAERKKEEGGIWITFSGIGEETAQRITNLVFASCCFVISVKPALFVHPAWRCPHVCVAGWQQTIKGKSIGSNTTTFWLIMTSATCNCALLIHLLILLVTPWSLQHCL